MERIFVSALPFRTSPEEIKKLFEQYGEVSEVQIFADWENASFEPYAHVSMTNAPLAIKELDGRIINSTYLRDNLLVKQSAG